MVNTYKPSESIPMRYSGRNRIFHPDKAGTLRRNLSNPFSFTTNHRMGVLKKFVGSSMGASGFDNLPMVFSCAWIRSGRSLKWKEMIAYIIVIAYPGSAALVLMLIRQVYLDRLL